MDVILSHSSSLYIVHVRSHLDLKLIQNYIPNQYYCRSILLSSPSTYLYGVFSLSLTSSLHMFRCIILTGFPLLNRHI